MDAQLADQPRDAIRDYARLSGPGAGQDEQRPFAVRYGIALLRIESAEVDHSGAW